MKRGKTLSALLAAAMAATLLAGCTTGSGTVLVGNENNTPTMMSMSYEKFTGYKQTTVTVEDEPVEVNVAIVTEGGKLDASIVNTDTGESSYEGNDMGTTSFTVTLSDPGKYTLRVDAEKHTGSYSFSWGD